jgi:two-component system cell cycle response regulator
MPAMPQLPDTPVLRQFWSAPDPLLIAAGQEGEALVARIRLVVIALLLITPVWKLFIDPDYAVYRWGFAVTLAGFVAAAIVFVLLRTRHHGAWLSFASSLLDVSFVSAALWIFMFVGSPMVALNSKVTFEIYFLTIGALALRHDRRVCLVAGVVAVLQYAALVVYARLNFDLADASKYGQLEGLGGYSDIDQITRLILLAAAVLLAYTLVERGRSLLDHTLRDRLTGAFTRAFLERLMVHELARAARAQEPLVLVTLDIDHFKRINDRHGHQFGDQALREFAATLMWRLRRSEALARWGGEEFVVVLPGADLRTARIAIDRIRRAVAQLRIATPDGPLSFTFSAGLAVFPADGSDLDALFAAADARLLAAKRDGRDRTVG